MKNHINLVLGLLLATLCSSDIAAQTGGQFAITRYVIGGGGALSAGSSGDGDLGLTGTIAQPAAGTNSTESVFGVSGGFWQSSFLPTSAHVSVTGNVLRSNNARVSGARVVFASPTGNVRRAITNSFGFFVVEGLEAGNTYIVHVEKKGLSFAPIALFLTEDVNGLVLMMLD